MKIKDNKIPANNKNTAICFMVAHCFFMSLGTVLLKLMQFDYHITQIMFFYNLLLCVTLLCLSFFGRNSLRISCANIKYHFFPINIWQIQQLYLFEFTNLSVKILLVNQNLHNYI